MTQRLTDSQLIRILSKAGRRLNRKLCLYGTTDEIVVDSSGCITPQDGRLEDLVLLQAECMLANRDIIYDLGTGGGGLMAKDGEQIIDTRQSSKARTDHLNSKYGPCAELDEAIKLELMKRGGGGTVGGGIGYDIW